MSGRSMARGLIPAGLGLGGFALLFYSSILSGLQLTEHDRIDSRVNNYVLEHGWRWMTGDPLHSSFWNSPVFFPVANVAAYTDNLLGSAPIYWFFRAIGLPIDLAFSFWAFSLPAINFAVTFWFLRRVVGVRAPGASAGAFIFAYSSSRSLRSSTFSCFPISIRFWRSPALTRLLAGCKSATDERLWVAALFASLVAQLYAGFYLGWFLCFAMILATAWCLVFSDTRSAALALLRRRWQALALGGALAACGLWPFVSRSLDAARTVGFRPYVAANSPTLATWLYVAPDSQLYGWMSSIEPFRSMSTAEPFLGIGLFTTAAAILGLFRHRANPGVRIAALTGATLVLLVSRLPLGVDPWRAVYELVPGANAIRAPSRLGLVLLIPGAIGFALWLDGRRAVWAGALALALLVSEQVRSSKSFDRLAIWSGAAQSVAGASRGACGAFLYAPASGFKRDEEIQVDAMFGELESGIPTVNGYSGSTPPDWPFLGSRTETPTDRSRVRADVEQWARHNGLASSSICVTTGQGLLDPVRQ